MFVLFLYIFIYSLIFSIPPTCKKGPIATLYCDVPTEKVIFKGERMHVRM